MCKRILVAHRISGRVREGGLRLCSHKQYSSHIPTGRVTGLIPLPLAHVSGSVSAAASSGGSTCLAPITKMHSHAAAASLLFTLLCKFHVAASNWQSLGHMSVS